MLTTAAPGGKKTRRRPNAAEEAVAAGDAEAEQQVVVDLQGGKKMSLRLADLPSNLLGLVTSTTQAGHRPLQVVGSLLWYGEFHPAPSAGTGRVRQGDQLHLGPSSRGRSGDQGQGRQGEKEVAGVMA